MSLFENETVTVSKIYTVNIYSSEDEFGKKTQVRYDSFLTAHELIFFVSGEDNVVFGDKSFRDEPNSLRYLPKGKVNGEYKVERVSNGYCIDIYFDIKEEILCGAGVLKNMTELKSLFVKIHNVWNEKKRGYYSESMALLYGIIKRIQVYSEKYITTVNSEKILPSYNYISENYCKCSGLSYSYFKTLFKMQYGCSPVKYVTMRRIEKAKELLITKRHSVTEISEMCGFDNVYYFSKVFKDYVGVSPQRYAKIGLPQA